MKRIRLLILAILMGLIFAFPTLAQSTSALEAVLENVAQQIIAQTEIPVVIPAEIPLRHDEMELYGEIFGVDVTAYELYIVTDPNCGQATVCTYGKVRGESLRTAPALATVIQERQHYLENATFASPELLQIVILDNGLEATVLPWFGYTRPLYTDVIVEHEGVRYTFSIQSGEVSSVIDMANTAVLME